MMVFFMFLFIFMVLYYFYSYLMLLFSSELVMLFVYGYFSHASLNYLGCFLLLLFITSFMVMEAILGLIFVLSLYRGVGFTFFSLW